MCEGIFGGVIDLNYLFGEKPELEKAGDEIVIFDLSGYTEEERKEIKTLWDGGFTIGDIPFLNNDFENDKKMR